MSLYSHGYIVLPDNKDIVIDLSSIHNRLDKIEQALQLIIQMLSYEEEPQYNLDDEDLDDEIY